MSLHFRILEDQNIFFIATHPPHHLRFDKDIMHGMQRHYVSLEEVEPGEMMSVTFSYSLRKIILRNGMFGCKKDNQELDICLRNFIEKELSCTVPGIRGPLQKSPQYKNCTLGQMKKIYMTLHDLGEDACPAACELYVPKITRQSHRYYQKRNATSEQQIYLMLHTEQLDVPVEETILAYDSLDAMADIGGYLGLLLGASCLSMIKNIFVKMGRLLKKWNHKKLLPGHKFEISVKR